MNNLRRASGKILCCSLFSIRTITFGITLLLCVTFSSFAQKAFDEYKVDKTYVPFSGYTSQTLPSATIDVNVTVNSSNQVNKIRRSLFGHNAVGYQGNFDSTSLEEKNWKAGNFSLLRYPGGNWSNKWFWDGNVPGSIQSSTTVSTGDLLDGTSGWMLETDEFPDLLDYTGADGIVCVNVGYAFYGTGADPVADAAQYAADWVDFYNVQNNVDVKYWELGNENYGPWQAGFDLANAQEYGDACVIFANAMKAVDPNIKIGVVFYEGYGGFNSSPQAVNWNETVLPIVENIMDFAIIHHYPHPNTNQNDITEPAIYDAISVVEETYDMMHDQVTTYTSKPADYYPVAITEFNARTGIRNMSRTNTLFTTLMLCEYAKYDYGAAMQWDLVNGYDATDGDHGLVARRDPFLQTGAVNPEFYAFYYLDKYMGDMMVESSSDNTDIITYATTFTSGELGLVVVNRGDTDKTVELNLGSYQPGERMYWHTINGDFSDHDRTVYINGQGPDSTFVEGQLYTSNFGNNERSEVATAYDTNGVSGPQDYENVMPYSSTVPAGDIKFSAPRYSVSYIVFEPVDGDCAVPEIGPNQSLCGVTDITLESGLTASGKTFTWKNGVGTVVGSGTSLIVNTADTYSLEVDSNGCVIVDEVIISDVIDPIDLGADIHLCQTTSATLSVGNTNPYVSVAWEKDGAPYSTNDTITTSSAGVYTAIASASGCTDVTDQLTITSALINVTNDTVCSSGETATLTINDTGDFEWFDAASNGNSISTASTISPTITSSTTYYVQDNATTNYNLGKTAQDGGVWGNTVAGVYSNWGREMTLTVEQDIELTSFDVFVNTNGANVQVNIYNAGLSYNQSWNFNGLSNTQQTLTLNATLPADVYTIDLVGTTGGVFMQHENAGDNIHAGLLSFINPDDANIYGFFYNWVVEAGAAGCNRTPVYAVIDPNNSSCAPVDCNGDPGGTAVLDNCGSCTGGNSGNIACTQDCNGDWGGIAVLDNCGTCTGGNSGNVACTQDCNGDWGGIAVLDNCGTCTGGNSGNVACTQDCNGDWGGSAMLDNCGTCTGGNSGNVACTQDCNGDWGGSASIDLCSECSGGSTGVTPNSSCEDCNGDPNGTASIDNCSVCSGGNTGITIDDCLTPINQSQISQSINIYPNPTSGQIYLDQTVKFQVYNVLGNNILNGEGRSIDLNSFPNGVYIIRVDSQEWKVFKY